MQWTEKNSLEDLHCAHVDKANVKNSYTVLAKV
jgi:hypothetical protein